MFIARSQIKKLENAKKKSESQTFKRIFLGSKYDKNHEIYRKLLPCYAHLAGNRGVVYVLREDCDVNSLAPQTLGVSPMCSFLCKLELEDSLHMHLLFEFEVRHFFLMNRTFHLLHLLIFDAYCIVYFIFINYVHAHH